MKRDWLKFKASGAEEKGPLLGDWQLNPSLFGVVLFLARQTNDHPPHSHEVLA